MKNKSKKSSQRCQSADANNRKRPHRDVEYYHAQERSKAEGVLMITRVRGRILRR